MNHLAIISAGKYPMLEPSGASTLYHVDKKSFRLFVPLTILLPLFSKFNVQADRSRSAFYMV